MKEIFLKIKQKVIDNKLNIIVYGSTTLFTFITMAIAFIFIHNSHQEKLEAERVEKARIEEVKELERKEEEERLKKELILRKLKEKQDRINSLDLDTDNSLTKFTSSNVSFNNKAYIPENLVSISSDYVYDSKGGYQKVRKEAKEALDKMSIAFYEKFEKSIVVVSAYRSYAYQKGIKDRGCPDNLCAKAGYSEHQSGLAIDLWEASTQKQFLSKPHLKTYYEWLDENAHKYGYHNSYQKGLEIDTYEIEPWHWRYLGVELSTYLKEKEITIAEHYNAIKKMEPKS